MKRTFPMSEKRWYTDLSSLASIIAAIISGIVAPIILFTLHISSGIPPTGTQPTGTQPTYNPVISNVISRVSESFTISILIICIIMVTTHKILKMGGSYYAMGSSNYEWKKKEAIKPFSDFVNVIRNDNWDPSLSKFQFLLWTLVIVFAFLSVTLIRILSGNSQAFGALPFNLLALFGISAVGRQYDSDTPIS
jgi:hypothetical protein